MAVTSDQIEWLHSLMQELEDTGAALPMGDYAEVYEIIEAVREEVETPPAEPYTPRSVQDPMLVDVTGQQTVTINVIPGNMVVNVNGQSLIMDFWDDDSDGDPHARIVMTLAEWREFAEWMPERK